MKLEGNPNFPTVVEHEWVPVTDEEVRRYNFECFYSEIPAYGQPWQDTKKYPVRIVGRHPTCDRGVVYVYTDRNDVPSYTSQGKMHGWLERNRLGSAPTLVKRIDIRKSPKVTLVAGWDEDTGELRIDVDIHQFGEPYSATHSVLRCSEILEKDFHHRINTINDTDNT